jgi:mono/diheme cytochrome c family protein
MHGGTMNKLKMVLPALVLVGGLLAPATVSFATVAYSKTTGAKCAVCHTTGKNLNKVGECYKTKKDLKVCQAN